MSKLARAFVLGATLAAMNLAAMTTVAQAQANDEPTSNQDARPYCGGQHTRRLGAALPCLEFDGTQEYMTEKRMPVLSESAGEV
jgi:hypothetical protein